MSKNPVHELPTSEHEALWQNSYRMASPCKNHIHKLSYLDVNSLIVCASGDFPADINIINDIHINRIISINNIIKICNNDNGKIKILTF